MHTFFRRLTKTSKTIIFSPAYFSSQSWVNRPCLGSLGHKWVTKPGLATTPQQGVFIHTATLTHIGTI